MVGFSLIELLIAMMLLATVSLFLLSYRHNYFERKEKIMFYREVNYLIKESFFVNREQIIQTNRVFSFDNLETYVDKMTRLLKREMRENIDIEMREKDRIVFVKTTQKKEYRKEIYFPLFQ